MKSSSHGREQGQISQEAEKAKIHSAPNGYLEGQIQGTLAFWNNRALSQLLVSLPGYKDVPWNISLLRNHTKESRIYVSFLEMLWSWQETVAMQSDKDSQAVWQSIIALFAL